MAGHINNDERVRDMLAGLYALLEEDQPSEEATQAARALAGVAHRVAIDLVDERVATDKRVIRAAGGGR